VIPSLQVGKDTKSLGVYFELKQHMAAVKADVANESSDDEAESPKKKKKIANANHLWFHEDSF